MFLRERTSRRRFLVLAAAMAGAAAGLGASSCEPPLPSPAVPTRGRANGMAHLAWAWHFGVDGPPERIASVLAQNNLGLILKSHNGTRMDVEVGLLLLRHQRSRPYCDTLQLLREIRHSFPHVRGLAGTRPAARSGDVRGRYRRRRAEHLHRRRAMGGLLVGHAAGGDGSSAQEFRRLQPNGTLYLCVEPRPWVTPRIPMAEFASFSQGIAPMVYWETLQHVGKRAVLRVVRDAARACGHLPRVPARRVVQHVRAATTCLSIRSVRALRATMPGRAS